MNPDDSVDRFNQLTLGNPGVLESYNSSSQSNQDRCRKQTLQEEFQAL